MPKEIYHNIRKKLLPYDKSLFWVVLQLLWLLVLSYGVSELVRMLRAFNTTATIKVLATASVGILPHMFNTIFWDAKGGDGKELWKKELKENVKRLVETLPIHKIVLSLPASSEAERNSESGEQQQNDDNDEPQNVENDEPQNVENDESQNVENAESQNVENAEPQNVENDESQIDENDEPQIDENDEHARLLTSHKDEDIQNEIGYVLKLLGD